MYKLVKTKLGESIADKAGTSKANLFNTNPAIMKSLCMQDPSYIKYARGSALSLELLDIVLNHPNYEEKMLFNAVPYYDGMRTHPEIMKKLCSINGAFLKYCRGKALTYEHYQAALQAPHSSQKYEVDFYLSSADYEDVNPKEVEKLLEVNGLILSKLDEEIITKKMIEIALNNPDPNKRPDIRYNHTIRSSKKLMKYLCEIDGQNFIYVTEISATPELLKLALNHPDPEKRLLFEKIPDSFINTFKYNDIKSLVFQDSRWIKYVDLETIGENDLNDILKKTDIIPTVEIVTYFKKSKKVLNTIAEMAETGKYTLEDLVKMTSLQETDRKFINSDFFTRISKIICEKEEIDYNFLKYFLERSISSNNEILRTLNLKILHPRFHQLYEENGYEKLFTITTYPEIQSQILEIGNPIKEDGTIDIELGDKRIQLLARMLKSSLSFKNGDKISEWSTYYNTIIEAFYKSPKKFDDLAQHQDELTDDLLVILTNHVLGKHSYNIKTIDDLKNYEKIKTDWIEKGNASGSIHTLREAALEKVFGISMETVTQLEPYKKGILLSPESFHPDMVNFFKTIDSILKEEDPELLRKTVLAFDQKEKLDEKDIIHLRSMLKKQYVKEYNASLFKIGHKQPDTTLRGVKVYKAAGKKGDQSFNLCIHALGAYFGSGDLGKLTINYQEDWNRPQISNHGICSSYIGNSNLGTALTPYAVLGFTDYEEGSLLLAGPADIYSSNDSFDVMGSEDRKSTYLMPKDMLDYTRHTHNEIVFERKVGNNKRQPSYAVLICDNYEKAMLQYQLYEKLGRYTFLGKFAREKTADADNVYHALKAAKDFGVPIVVVEREKIAKNEHQKIMNRLEEFKNDSNITQEEAKSYFHDILTIFGNNYAGNRGYHLNIVANYFSEKEAQKIVQEIKSKIEALMVTNPSSAAILIDELANVMKLEKEKAPSFSEPVFSTKAIFNFCNNKKSELNRFKAKKLNINDIFEGVIKNNDNLLEYESLSLMNLDPNQYSMNVILPIISGDRYERFISKASQIEQEGLYKGRENSIHSQRHIENVMFFATIIALDELSEKETDLLLTAALYHDAGRVDDKNNPHAIASSALAQEKLKDKYSTEDLQIIRAAIEYHEVVEEKNKNGTIDFTSLDTICHNLGMDISDQELMKKTRKIAIALKDADALDRTRFLATSKAFVNPDMLHFDISKKLIKIGMQINEYYATNDLIKVCDENPDLSNSLLTHLLKKQNPKLTLRCYHRGEIKTFQFLNAKKLEIPEEEIRHGKK